MLTPWLMRSAGAGPPLRLGVLAFGPTVSRFAGALLECIARSNFARVELIVELRPARRGLAARARALSAIPFQLYARLDRAVAGEGDPLAPVDPGPWLDGAERLEIPVSAEGEAPLLDTTVVAIEGYDLDVLLCLDGPAPSGRVRRAARFGLWAYRFGAHSDAPGALPFFRDLADRARFLDVRLEALGVGEAGETLGAATFASQPSPFLARQRQLALWESTHLLLAKLRELHERGWDHVRGHALPAPALAWAALPSPVEVARLIVPRVTTSLFRRIRHSGSQPYVWRVGLHRGGSLFDEPGSAGELGDRFQWLDAPHGHFLSDPFIHEHGGARYLFMEDMDLARGYAGISVVEFFPNGSIGPVVRCLDPGFHLSFPLVFDYDGETFMLPESQSNGTVTLYRARRFPEEWVQEKVLFRGNAVDTVVLQHEGLFYFFTTLFERDDRGMTTAIFVADSPTSTWRIHPRSPISSDARAARGAGHFIRRGGRLFRTAQNCGPRYGYGLVFREVLTLTEEAYEERPFRELGPEAFGPRVLGIHSYNALGDLEVVDAAVRAADAHVRWSPPRRARASCGALVSVIIPTYNRAHCIRRAVDSVLGQTHADVDVIIVDDGSQDDTRSVVNDTYGKNPRVRYIHKENGGVSSARNVGIRQVKGDYAALLDSDDSWKPFKLELQLASLRAFPDAGMCWTDMTAVGPGGEVVREHYLRRFYSGYRIFPMDELFDESLPLTELAAPLAAEVGGQRAFAGDIYPFMVLGNLVHTSTVLLRRERLAEAGLFDERRRSGEDHEFHLHACRAGRVVLADVDTTLYTVGASDQLTQPQYAHEMAANYLATLTEALARDRARIQLSRERIDGAVADAHSWVADTLLALGRRKEARGHLASSLRWNPRQPRVLGLLAASLLPASIEGPMRDAYRATKRGLGRSA